MRAGTAGANFAVTMGSGPRRRTVHGHMQSQRKIPAWGWGWGYQNPADYFMSSYLTLLFSVIRVNKYAFVITTLDLGFGPLWHIESQFLFE